MKQELQKRRGKGGQIYTPAQRIEIAKSVIDLYVSEGCTFESAANACNVPERTVRVWLVEVAELAEYYKKAKETADIVYWDRIRQKASTALERLLDGETVEDEVIESYPIKDSDAMKVAKVVKRVSRTTPNPTSVIFALKGEYPERFKDRVDSTVKHTIEGGKSLTPDDVEGLKRILGE